MSKCSCGCGQDVVGSNSFVLGHNRKGKASFFANGRWSMNYDCCRECGTTERVHRRDGYCYACARKKLYSGDLKKKRDLLSGRWSRKFDCCVECGTTDRPHKAGGRCANCLAKKRVRDLGGKNLVEGQWSRDHEKCVNCGTTSIPHCGNGLCDVCHNVSKTVGLEAANVVCPVCGAVVFKLHQHLAIRAKFCESHKNVYNYYYNDIVSAFHGDKTSREIAESLGMQKRRVLDVWHENFSEEEIQKRGEKIRISKISGENNYLFGTIPHTNITKRYPFLDKRGRFFLMRSSWEVKYAEYMDRLGIVWEYEAHKFKYYTEDGLAHYYFPDFYIPAENIFIEIKGFYSDFSRHKIQECTRLYNINVKVLEYQDLINLGILPSKETSQE